MANTYVFKINFKKNQIILENSITTTRDVIYVSDTNQKCP